MNKYGLHGKLKAKPGKGNELSNILLENLKTGETMPGCHIYIVAKDSENPDHIWVTEVWDSKEAHADSLKLESVRTAITKAMPLLDGMPEKGTITEVLGGLGLED